jgi:23S rRNA (pseudouridine1915-N3)-methyltransferase
MRIRVLWVGRTKEQWAADAVERYLKLLRPLAQVETVEVKHEPGPRQGGSPMQALAKEGKRVLRQAGPGFILLDERGEETGSEGLAGMIKDMAVNPGSAEFVIGGAFGVSQDVRRAAGRRLALSRMTLTHEMARVVLLEQLYRALMINQGRKYHH